MTEEPTTEVEAWGPERGSVVPLALLALLVFSRLAPDAGRSTVLGLEDCLPLPHSPAALCLRPIIPLPDPIFVLCSPRRPRGLKGRDLAPDPNPEKSIHNALGRERDESILYD